MRLRIVILSVVVVAAACAGCRRQSPADSPKAETPPPDRSTAETVIDGMTGNQAVRQGQQAKEKIRQISAKEQKDLDDVLGEGSARPKKPTP